MNTGIVFVPKIGAHLRKTEGTLEAYTKEELVRVVQLRASGLSYRKCGLALGRGGGSVACAITYHNLFGEIETHRKLMESEG